MKKQCLISLFSILVSCSTLAAETIVNSGVGALATAVAAAADGDTLILQDGDYTGAVTIDKSLTLRSMSRGAMVYIGSGAFVVEGEGIKVTLQGLSFNTQVTVNQGDDVRILENQFLSGVGLIVSEYKSSEGDGKLAVIGNQFSAGSKIALIRSDNAYIAGNKFVAGSIRADAGSVWVVGNEVNVNNGTLVGIELNGTAGEAKVIANRVTINRNTANSSGYFAIKTTNPLALISGNIVNLKSSFSHDYHQYNMYGIHASGQATFSNNVVDFQSVNNIGTGSYGIYASSGSITGNIVNKFQRHSIGTGTGTIENNICFMTGGSCGSAENGNLIADPKFVNLIDFKLDEGSPAIDTGNASPFYADLDRTRNDMGAYGGPWNIEQYDVQRKAEYFGPYVYPLFKANASISDGFINIRALGVARLR
jgi:hypothetical protein